MFSIVFIIHWCCFVLLSRGDHCVLIVLMIHWLCFVCIAAQVIIVFPIVLTIHWCSFVCIAEVIVYFLATHCMLAHNEVRHETIRNMYEQAVQQAGSDDVGNDLEPLEPMEHSLPQDCCESS